MNMERHTVRVRGGQRGFTLIEILIALLIGVFLLAALLTIVQANRRVYGDQSQLAQLQDSERMAMTLMTDVIQMAGYYPNPTQNTVDSLTASGAFALGQPITNGRYRVVAQALPPLHTSPRLMMVPTEPLGTVVIHA